MGHKPKLRSAYLRPTPNSSVIEEFWLEYCGGECLRKQILCMGKWRDETETYLKETKVQQGGMCKGVYR
jgi:hypothetical protein